MTAADVREAVLRLYRAAEDARAVSELPAEIGARVHWSNGVIWERVDENEWAPVTFSGFGDEISHIRAPSLHVASGTITHVEHAPVRP